MNLCYSLSCIYNMILKVALLKEVNTDVLISNELTHEFRSVSSELLVAVSENIIKIYKL